MDTEILEVVIKAVKEAGAFAVSHQAGIEAVPKRDKSPVTKVDLAVSKMIQKAIKPYTDLPNHALIDEENEEDKATPWKLFSEREFAWFIDPISGTLSYLNGLPFFGISVGLLRKGKPYLGVVSIPALKELYWYINGKAYCQIGDSPVRLLKKNKVQMTPFSLFYVHIHQHFTLSEKISRTISFPAVQPGFIWSATGRFSGALIDEIIKVWDFAGAWGICQACGLDFYTLKTGKKMDAVTSTYFNEQWQMKMPMILTKKDNLDTLRKNTKVVVK